MVNAKHNSYGGYPLAKIILNGLRDAKLPLASWIVNDVGAFDPSKPDPVATFAIPPSSKQTTGRPLGDERNQ
jgi:hypothetical protein